MPDILLKLPIMLWSNAPEFCLLAMINLCPIYVLCYKFNFLSKLNYKIMNISSLSSCSTVQDTINNSSTYMYINTLNSFLLHLQLYLTHILTKSLPQTHPSLTILLKVCILYNFCQLCWQFLPIILALCSILLHSYILCSKL